MNARRQIIAALSEDSHGGIATLEDVTRAEQLVGVHRIEVLREASAVAIAERLTDDTGQPEDVAYNQAIDDVTTALTRLAYGERSDEARDFFQPGHTYTDGNGYQAPEIVSYFRVECVTRHPDRGHLRAIGWLRSGAADSGWHGDFRDEDEYSGWTDVTEGGGQ